MLDLAAAAWVIYLGMCAFAASLLSMRTYVHLALQVLCVARQPRPAA